MRRIVSFGPAIVVLLAMVAGLMFVPTLVREVTYARTLSEIRLAQYEIDDDDILERINRATRAIARKIEPSIVHMEAWRGRGGSVSNGSGWIFDAQGHIVTNAHVVRDARRVDVHLYDGRRISAKVVGTDLHTDIAIVKLDDASNIVACDRGTGEHVEQGDRVFAFGSPFGFKFSMSEGIVSGLGRNPTGAVGATGFTNLIQTDAAVNPGNSGGPLVDVRGRVVGMNVAIATGRESDGTTEGQSSGISFAIPLDTIESVATQLIKNGKVARGFMGINYTNEQVVSFHDNAGAWHLGIPIQSVSENGPSQLAGLQPGDLIVEIDGQRTVNAEVLRARVALVYPGSQMRVLVWRDGEFVTTTVTAAEFPAQQFLEQMAGRYGIFFPNGGRENSGSAVLAEVGPRTPAYEAGLRRGQRIVSVNDEPVDTAERVLELIERAGFLDGRAVPIEVENSQGERRVVNLRIVD